MLLTRRLSYSLSLAGYRSTLLAPARHASLLLADPWIDSILDSESPRFAGAFAGSWPEEGGGFDVAVLISNSSDLEKAVRLAAAKVVRLPPGPVGNDRTIAQQWADAASDFCAPFIDGLPLLRADAPEALVSGATLIHPGSGSPGKNWPMEAFIKLSRRLSASGHLVAWIRGPAEADFTEAIAPDRVLDRPSLEALAATIGQSRLFIGNDSGVSHLAGAMGTPSVVLFGPTDPAIWRPDGRRVRIVRAGGGDLAGLQVEDVVAATDDMARLSPARRR